MGRPGRRRFAGPIAAIGRNRSLRRAELSFGAVWVSEWAFTVALAVIAFRHGGTTTVAIVAFVRTAPAAVLSPIGTSLADHFPRERVLRWACWVRAAAVAVAAAVLAAGGAMAWVYIAAVVATAAFTVYRPAHSALLPMLCASPAELTSAHVVRGFVDSVSTLVGPLLAALLLRVTDEGVTVAAIAALAGWSAWMLRDLRYEVHADASIARRAPRLVAHTLEGLRRMSRQGDAALLAGLAAVQTFTRGCLNVLMVVIAVRLLHTGDTGVGLLAAAIGAGAIAGSAVVSMFADSHRLALLVGVGVALWGLPLAIIAIAPYSPVAVPMMAVIGIGNALVDVGLFTLPARLVPDAFLARYFGALESLIALSVAAGSVLTPLALAVLGDRGALAVAGLLGPAAFAVAWARLKRIDASVSRLDAEVAVLKQVPMLGPLPMPAVDMLASRLCRCTVPAGASVFESGDIGERFYVIAAGEAEVVRHGERVRVLGPGDGFGEIALIRRGPRTATVRALTSLELLAVERDDFLTVVTGYAGSAGAAEATVTRTLAADEAASGR